MENGKRRREKKVRRMEIREGKRERGEQRGDKKRLAKEKWEWGKEEKV